MINTSTTTPLDLDMFECLKRVVQQGLDYIAEDSDRRLSHYDGFWSVGYGAQGMPAFNEDNAPGGRVSLYGPYQSDEIRGIVQPWVNFVDSRSDLAEYFSKNLPPIESPEVGMTKRYFFEQRVASVAEDLIERYLLLHPGASLCDEHFISLYMPMERGIILSSLPVEVVVPLPLVTFDSDGFELGAGAYIWRMDDNFQLARMNRNLSRNDHAPAELITSATHALVFRGFTIENMRNMLYPGDLAAQVYTSELVGKIGDYLTLLRVMEEFDTGFVQIIVRPVDWAHEYRADLPYIDGFTLPYHYPRRLDAQLDNLEVLNVSADGIPYISKRFVYLASLSSVHKLRVALGRLNSYYTRESGQDALLDAVIGLETMLNDSGTELTYKIALRTAALSQRSRAKFDAKQVFKHVKDIYDYRSTIAHGRGHEKKSKNLETLNVDGEQVPTWEVAQMYLRLVTSVVMDNPAYVEPLTIDDQLIIGKL